ncbi:MAG: phage holin family protein [Nocardioides sp.]
MSRPVSPYPSEGGTQPVAEASVGQLVGQVASDLSTLVRQEMELARAELKEEVAKAGKGAGLLGGAGYAGLLLGVFASLTAMFLLDLALPLWAAALVVTAVWGVVGAVLFRKGRQQLQSVNPTPTRTVDSLKETF